MRLSSLQKRMLLVWSMGLMMVAVCFYFFILMPMFNDLNRQQDKLNLEQQKYETLKRQVEEQTEESIPVATVLKSIPSSMEEDGVIQLINNASEASKIVVQSYQYLERLNTEVDGEELKQLAMQINGDAGSLKALNNFTEQLESSERLVKIHSLDFQQNGEDVSFQIQFNVYAKVFGE
ncbi:type 4a pilus biogenesis protein PilO [Piscibacillus halophilus]|uniref:Tfp pilus assembly protein PilO n=1 Tax=Piscibacillus halophilus TaxID=571933 RepID=A0A1H9GGE4_9BACI|nr:type 4a pilus biogenesis protein PilO [Piscibacillus halophilus]SEQ49129.1 Tfp pilus assembly protein PilO [Piscibacillus halophilus]